MSDSGSVLRGLSTEGGLSTTPIPKTFSRLMEVSDLFSVTPGVLSKLRLRPQILNEHTESSREAIGTINSTTSVGQVFKASHDNINGLLLTLESAASETTIDDIEEANDAALQLAWVKTGTNEAVLETTIISTNNSSTKSMDLDMSTLNDLWKFTKPATSWDMTGATVEFDYYQTSPSSSTTMTLTIDSGAASVVTLSVPADVIHTWQHFSIPVESFIGSANVSAITNVSFKVTSKTNNQNAYVDNFRFRPAPGSVSIELWDHGTTIPVSATTVYTDGTQYATLGDLGIGGSVAASVNLPLKGGKQLYHVDEFIAGVATEIPTNATLTVDNYYSVVIKYVDTDVTVFGPDTTHSVSYYTAGFGWSAPTGTGIMTVLAGAAGAGVYSDLMFGILSTQDVYLSRTSLSLFDASVALAFPDVSTEINIFCESDLMVMELVSHRQFIQKEHTVDLMQKPLLLPKGGKIEVYYSSHIGDLITSIIFGIQYFFTPVTTNGVRTS